MALQYRRGSAAIQEAATKRSGGFQPFLPQIQWPQDGESKYVIVLTDIDEVAELLLHSFVPVGKGEKANGESFTRYDEFLSRKDPAIGESYDDLEDRLEREPKTRCMGVMAELEPIMEGGTSKKLKGFAVKTETFTRKTDDGEVEVTAPVIGLCTQSAITLWGAIDSLYQSLGDLIEIPVQITRRGVKTNTRYDIIPFMEKPVDLSPIIEYVEGINYVGDDLEEVLKLLDAEESEVGKAQAVAGFLLNKRIDALADPVRYEEKVGPLKLEDMPKNPWNRKPAKKESRERPVRRSQREVAEPDNEPTKTARFADLKNRVENQG